MATTQETIRARAAAPPVAAASNMKWVGLGIALVLGLAILFLRRRSAQPKAADA